MKKTSSVSIQRSKYSRMRVMDDVFTHLAGEFVDEREGLASFVAHQADGRLVHHIVEDHEEVVLEHFVGADKVVPQIALELVALLAHVGEVDEEA